MREARREAADVGEHAVSVQVELQEGPRAGRAGGGAARALGGPDWLWWRAPGLPPTTLVSLLGRRLNARFDREMASEI